MITSALLATFLFFGNTVEKQIILVHTETTPYYYSLDECTELSHKSFTDEFPMTINVCIPISEGTIVNQQVPSLKEWIASQPEAKD